MKVSILLTAWKEERSIVKCIQTLLDPEINSQLPEDFELLLAAPDEPTHQAALKEVQRLGIEDRFHYIQDPQQGKPLALRMLMDSAQGDVWFYGDGDTYFGPNVLALLQDHFSDPDVHAVSGRPFSRDDRSGDALGYYSHLLVDAAHHKRMVDLTDEATGKSLLLVKKRPFFPMSGYVFATRRHDIRPPENCLIEDAYISYEIFNQGGKLQYEPEAKVYVKFPRTWSDFFKQKKRTNGGFVQLWQFGIVKPEAKPRSIWQELEYVWYPIKYAQNLRELIWSLLFYPIRLYLWVQIYWERKVVKKDFASTWQRIESSK